MTIIVALREMLCGEAGK